MYKTEHHPTFKIITWLNIFVMLFMQALAFVSVADAAKRSGVEYSRQQTETTVYLVGYGETAETIAAKYNIGVSALRSLNTRTFFKKDFDHLQKGDVLVVPARVAAENGAVTDPKVAGYLNEAATFLSNGGTGSDLADTIEARARSFFIGGTIGRANSTLEQWLNQYGTARVQLAVDEHFSLKNSQFDLLLPLWERKNRLFFTQGSFHRTDDRNQTNLGFGYRYFTADYMVGGNAFFDYDLTRSHSRMGLGFEYSRDYLRLGVNSYIRLSEWRDSRDFDNYEERPANGWDMRAEAYLPFHPQLGFKLSWEQYYGDEVALFGKNSRQHNPYAVTFGANYTPFPLMTLSAEHREGASGKNDTRFGVQMTYRMGVPLRDQLDPGAVDGLRKLGGGRYDFVERNNNIVLEYREKKGIKLAMRHEITGFAYEDHSLEMTVESKGGVSRIDVSAPELVAAGGQIVSGGMDPSGYRVVLPPYHSGGDTANTYTIIAIAYDTKDRASNQETTRVVVRNVPVNAEQSLFEADPLTVVIGKPGADPKTHLTFTAFDGQGNPVSGLAADNKLEFVVEETVSVQAYKDGVVAAAGEITETEAGVYEADLTGTKVGSYKVTPKADGVLLGGIMLVVAFVNEGADVAVDGDDRSTFKAEPETIYVEGIEGAVQVSKLKFKAVDAFNNPILGLVAKGLAFAVADPADAVLGKAFTIGAVSETGKGIYEAEFRARMAAGYKIEPRLGGVPVHAQLFAEVAALAEGGAPDGGSGDGQGEDGKSPETGAQMTTFVANPKLIYVEGAEGQKALASELKLAARDQYGNPLAGLTAAQLKFKAFVGAEDRTADVTVANFRETGGVYTADFSSKRAAIYRIEPHFDGAQIGKLYGDVEVSAEGSRPDGGSGDGTGEDGRNPGTGERMSTFVVSPKKIYVDGVANQTAFASELEFTARDSNGNPLAGLTADKLKFKAFVGAEDRTADVTVANFRETGGVYTADFSSNRAATYRIIPYFGDTKVGKLYGDVEVSAEGGAPGGGSGDGAGEDGKSPETGAQMTTFVANPKLIYVEGVAGQSAFVSKLELAARDKHGNPLTGITAARLKFKAFVGAEDRTADVTVANFRETGGVYTADFSSKRAATYRIEPHFDDAQIGKLYGDIQVSADGSRPGGGSGDGKGEDGKNPDTGAQMSTFEASPELIYVAGVKGQSAFISEFRFTARDSNGNPLTGITAAQLTFKAFVSAEDRTADVTVANFREADGVYTADFSSNRAATYRIEPYFDGAQIGKLYGDVEVSAEGGAPGGGSGDGKGEDGKNPDTGAQMSTFEASPKLIYVEGVEGQNVFVSKLEFTARDQYGNPLASLTAAQLTFKAFVGAEDRTADVTVANFREADGVYTADFSSNRAATYRIEPYFDGAQIGKLYGDVEVSAEGNRPDGGSGDGKGEDGKNPDTGAQMSTFEADPATVYVDAVTGDVQHVSVITFTARDQYGNDIANIADKLRFVGTGKAHQTTVTLEGTAITANGNVYTADFSHNTVDEYVTSGENTAPDAGKSSFDATPLSIRRSSDGAGDQAKSVLTFTARDKYGNPIEDLDLAKDKEQLVFDVAPVAEAGSAAFDNTALFYTVTDITKGAQAGAYTASFYGTRSGAYVITPKYVSRDGAVKQDYTARIVTIEDPTREDLDKSRTTLVAEPDEIMVSDGSEANTAEYKYVSTLIFSAQDSYGNPIPALAGDLEFGVTLPANVSPGEMMLSSITEKGKGSYTATFTSKKIGGYTFKPQLGKEEVRGIQTVVEVNGDIASSVIEVGAVTLNELGLGTKRTDFVKNAPVTWTSAMESGEVGVFEDEAGHALVNSEARADEKGIATVYLRSKMNQSAVNVAVSAATDYMKTLPAPNNKEAADKTVTFVGYEVTMTLRQTTISAKIKDLDGSATEVNTFMAIPYPPSLMDDNFTAVDLGILPGTTYFVEGGLAEVSTINRDGVAVKIVRATSEAGGTATLKGTGTGSGAAGTAFNRISYEGAADIAIKPARKHGLLGQKFGAEKVSVFGADTDYTFGGRAGYVIDAIGAPESGTGGGFITVDHMNKVVAIKTIWGAYTSMTPRVTTICQLEFVYEAGSGLANVKIGGTQTPGDCSRTVTPRNTNTFDIPAGEAFVGVISTKNRHNLVSSVEWVTIDRDAN
ncbi:MAG: Invasin [Candidatus Tokpelaia hoelldobleri]|uniref:Invasin n=1 Tax=Candidatus Tokpelaia hoelldobleri TaxID=1902579 RepID=A0A1U9JTI8_9HYPH|nr:MAG: Invasin [Candidatus Tokpelaia hoelldoblerii]